MLKFTGEIRFLPVKRCCNWTEWAVLSHARKRLLGFQGYSRFREAKHSTKRTAAGKKIFLRCRC
jgi:hypothetical protein